jgi:hypothetical protein
MKAVAEQTQFAKHIPAFAVLKMIFSAASKEQNKRQYIWTNSAAATCYGLHMK